MKIIILLNGKIVSAEEAKIPVLSNGALYGWGLFETMRACKNKIIYLDKHLGRLKSSCLSLGVGLNYPAAKLRQMIFQALKSGGFRDATVKLVVWKEEGRKSHLLLTAQDYRLPTAAKYKQGFSCLVSSLRQAQGSTLAGHKTINRLFYQLSDAQAKQKGMDEAIILNDAGYLCEASRSNLFLVKKNTLFTPSLECGCLNGITRLAVTDLARQAHIGVTEGNFTLQDLFQAEEAFLTNSLMGIMPVKSVEGHNIAKKENGLTALLSKKYALLFKK
jgi:branched-subunit amino acid aminotransferase/4-amino-4-deoxychorismate lyase